MHTGQCFPSTDFNRNRERYFKWILPIRLQHPTPFCTPKTWSLAFSLCTFKVVLKVQAELRLTHWMRISGNSRNWLSTQQTQSSPPPRDTLSKCVFSLWNSAVFSWELLVLNIWVLKWFLLIVERHEMNILTKGQVHRPVSYYTMLYADV